VDEVLPETGVLCGDSRPTIRQQRDVAVEAFTDQAAAARWTMKWRCSSENPDRDKLTESTTADVTTAPGDTFESRADPNPCPPPERRARGHPCTRRGARTRGSVPPFRASARLRVSVARDHELLTEALQYVRGRRSRADQRGVLQSHAKESLGSGRVMRLRRSSINRPFITAVHTRVKISGGFFSWELAEGRF
jgi:hypothetical protein